MPTDDSQPPSQPNIPPPVFLGYCVKEYWPTSECWWCNSWSAHVTEVCSASDCIASRPSGWEDWDFNRASCWNDEASALACIPPGEQARYCLYAYRAVPPYIACADKGESSGDNSSLPAPTRHIH